MHARLRVFVAVLLLIGSEQMLASGPRFVTGPPFFTGTAGVPIGWKQTTLLYSTDPGVLGPNVDHAASDAIVAAAAGTWNVPVAAITIGQGAPLAEHVSGQNVYLSDSGMVWPSDVSAASASSIPVAVIYDTDGSVTETLLGAGASDPSECQQSAVTESVDAFDPAGYILHAIIVINGRCTGPAPEQQLQLRYQLERVFGRVLGLAWSQLNDNVFTGTPTPNADQAMHWPIMHPLDILCGPYSYQCLPEPFTLRPDDIAGLVGLYPIPSKATPAPGKQASYAAAHPLNGFIRFPTGEGMAGVNVLVQRSPRYTDYFQDWYEASAVAGAAFRLNGVSPFETPATTAEASFGSTAAIEQPYYFVPYFEVTGPFGTQGEAISLEPVNPLYVGEASVGPYAAGIVSPAGSTPPPAQGIAGPLYMVENDFLVADAPSTCGDGEDGTPGQPSAVPSLGWWTGVTCGYGHISYTAQAVKPGRSLTVEVTALDANGYATASKMMPVIGVFAPTDNPLGIPSIGAANSAFNAVGIGTTVVKVSPFSPGAAGGIVQIGIADQRGDGRPDFAYQARLFYADSLDTVTLPPSGGVVTLTGTGFRAGNSVFINGVAANILTWTATTIVFTAPSAPACGATLATPVDLVVSDGGTGATSTMTGALTYSSSAVPSGGLKLISAPAGTLFTGIPAVTPFEVEALAEDGMTPVPGQSVSFSILAGSASFSGCATPCTVSTDANGLASVPVLPQQAGTITLQAASGGATLIAGFQAILQPARMVVQSRPAASVAVGTQSPTAFQVQVTTPNGAGIPGERITFTVTQGTGNLGSCNASPCTVTTNVYGQASVTVTPTSAGTVTITATDATLSQSTSLTAWTDTPQLKVIQGISTSAYVPEYDGRLEVQLLHSDGTTPIVNAVVVLSAPVGILWDACGGNVCETTTGATGIAAASPRGVTPGTYTLQVSYQGVSISFVVTMLARQTTLNIITAPSGTLPAGVVAPVPFAVQLLDGYGNPITGVWINLGGDEYKVVASCGTGNCIYITDSNGMASTTITPLLPGEIVLSATFANLNAQTTFTSTASPINFKLLSGPAAQVFTGDKQTFRYEVIGMDGVTPLPWQWVFLSVQQGSLAMDGCATFSCWLYTDGTSVLTMTATPWVPGQVTVLAASGGIPVSTTFTVVPKAATLRVLDAPSGIVLEGAPLSQPFSVQVLEADGKTPLSGQNVTFSVASGSASLTACPLSTYVVATDGRGVASTQVTAGSNAGPVSLLATDNAFSASAAFNVVAPEMATLVSAPATVYEGATSATPLALRVVAADGTTPVAGVDILVSATGQGSAILSACGQLSCTLVTDATGTISTAVMGLVAGSITLSATAHLAAGDRTITALLQVIPNVMSMTMGEPATYVAEGAVVNLEEDVVATINGSPAAGLSLSWTAPDGIRLGEPDSATDSSGKGSQQIAAGPLSGGTAVEGEVCAWVSVCGRFEVAAVAAGAQQISVISGGQQTLTGGVPFQPLVAQVTDGAGNAVAGANVNVGQTVYAYSGPCPVQGRCPASPVIASGVSNFTSDGTGRVWVTPMIIPGQATLTAIELSVGTQGFAAVQVSSTP